jgi:hypothetical protein
LEFALTLGISGDVIIALKRVPNAGLPRVRVELDSDVVEEGGLIDVLFVRPLRRVLRGSSETSELLAVDFSPPETPSRAQSSGKKTSSEARLAPSKDKSV